MASKLKMAGMLKRKGVDINVWSADRLQGDTVLDGIPQQATTDNLEPEKRHEPVWPVSSNSQILVLAAGGSQVDVDLLWASTGNYPTNTIVEVPTQGGKYRVTHFQNYLDYSDVVIYELKGDDHNQHI